jgi:predicted ATPase
METDQEIDLMMKACSVKISKGRIETFSEERQETDHDATRRSPEDSCKLRFPRKLYGRDVELQRLTSIYERISLMQSKQTLRNTQEDGRNPSSFEKENEEIPRVVKNKPETDPSNPSATPAVFVVIAGSSGTGKSTLVHHFIENIQAQAQSSHDTQKCYFLRGKFDAIQTADPFHGLVEAFNGFCEQVVGGKVHGRSRITEAIREAIGDHGVQALAQVIPSLAKLFCCQTSDTTSSSIFTAETNQSNHRMHYIFKNFVRAICTKTDPLILFLNDLQWIDKASLDLLLELAKEQPSIKHLMLIGAFRSDGADEPDHRHTLTGLTTLSGVERMDLENLSEDQISEFLADTLNLRLQAVTPLAELVYGQTKGNIFFARQYLEYLHLERALYRSGSHWTWDMKKIESVTGVSEDLAEIVTSKLHKLPVTLRTAMSMAAYMRSTFDVQTVSRLMISEGYLIQGTAELHSLLETAVFKGLLRNSVGSLDFEFHDARIQQAFYDLISPGKSREEFRQRMGKFLLNRSNSAQGENWMLFVAADNLNAMPPNSSQDTTAMDPLDLVRLNLKVGEKSRLVSAFQPASKYLKKALECLSKTEAPWKNNYDLTLRLYKAAADIELCVGNFERGKALCTAILENTESLHDKLRVQLSLANALGRQDRHVEAIEIHKEALYLIQEFPKKFYFAHVKNDFRKVKQLFQKHSDFEILLLPVMADEEKSIAMEHLTKLSQRAFQCNKIHIVLLCTLRQLRLSFKYGLCPETAEALASYGMLLCGTFDEVGAGFRMAHISKVLLENYVTESKDKMKAQSKMSRVLFITTVYIDAWSSPIAVILDQLQLAHSRGMESGDIESAYRAWAASNMHAYAGGFPLNYVLQDATNLEEQMQEYTVDSVLGATDPFRFMTLQLMGAFRAPPMDWKNMKCATDKKDSEASRWIWLYWTRLQLAYYFGELEGAEKIIGPFRELSGIDTSHIVTSIRVFFSGLAASALARKTGKAKYRKMAKKELEEMTKITKGRGLNSLHKCMLMEADIEASTDNKISNNVQFLFDRSITEALKAGVTQDAALANELAGEYFIKIHFDQAQMYFTRALNLYREWGAIAKAKHLLKTRGDYIDLPTSDPLWRETASTHFRCGDDSSPFHFGKAGDNISALTWREGEGSPRLFDASAPEMTMPIYCSRGGSGKRLSALSTSDVLGVVETELYSEADENSKSSLSASINQRLRKMFPPSSQLTTQSQVEES